MYGQKQIMQCFAFVMFAFLLNCYKSIVRKDKDQRQWIEQSRRHKAEELQIANENAAFERELQAKLHVANKQLQRTKMLEYNDSCPDLHVLIHRPDIYDYFDSDKFIRRYDYDDASAAGFEKTGENNREMPDESVPCKSADETFALIKDNVQLNPSTVGAAGPAATKPKIIDQIRESSSGIIYLMVLILMVSLGKAAYDLSKQFKAVFIIYLLAQVPLR